MCGRGATSSTGLSPPLITTSAGLNAGSSIGRRTKVATLWPTSRFGAAFASTRPISLPSREKPKEFPRFSFPDRAATAVTLGSAICAVRTENGSSMPVATSTRTTPSGGRSIRRRGCLSRTTSCSFFPARRPNRRGTMPRWAIWPWRSCSRARGMAPGNWKQRKVRCTTRPLCPPRGTRGNEPSKRRVTRAGCASCMRRASPSFRERKISKSATRHASPISSARRATPNWPASSSNKWSRKIAADART